MGSLCDVYLSRRANVPRGRVRGRACRWRRSSGLPRRGRLRRRFDVPSCFASTLPVDVDSRVVHGDRLGDGIPNAPNLSLAVTLPILRTRASVSKTAPASSHSIKRWSGRSATRRSTASGSMSPHHRWASDRDSGITGLSDERRDEASVWHRGSDTTALAGWWPDERCGRLDR